MGPEGPRGFSLVHLKPKAHAEEEEVPGDEWKESKLPECIAEGDPVLGRPKSWEKKRHIARGHTLEDRKRDSKPYGLTIGEYVGRQPQEKLSPQY